RPTIERFKTPLFYATDYEGGVCSRYIVCYSGLPEQWVSPFVPFLKQTYGDTFYMFGSDYVWPRKMNEAVRRAAEQAGGRIVAEVKKRFGETAIVSSTVDAHYMLTRFFIEGVKRAGAVDKEKIIDAVTGFQLESGNGMVRLRPEDRHADLNVVIAETKNQRQ